jgi:hypothetical protein
VLDTLAQHHLVEDLATSLANEPIHISALCIRTTTRGAIRSYDSSISCPRGLTRGWTCWRSVPWKAGLGTSRTFLYSDQVSQSSGVSQ